MAITGLEHLQLSAPRNSADRVRQFYGDLLELAEITPPQALAGREGVWYQLGPYPLHVAFEGYGFGNEPRFLALTVADLDVVFEALRQKIAPIESVADDEGSLVRLKFKDPFGNHLELTPAAAHDEAGPALAAEGYFARAELVTAFSAPAGEVEALSFSPDGRWLAVGTIVEDTHNAAASVTIWDLTKGGEPEVQVEMASSVRELAFSPTGRELAALTVDGSLETWRTSDWESEGFAEHAAGSTGLSYTAGGQLLAVGSEDVVHVYRPTLDQFLTVRPKLGAIASVAFDVEGTLAVVGEPRRIQLWTLQPAQRSSYELLGFNADIDRLAFCPGTSVLAGLTVEGELLLWDMYQAPEDPTPLDTENTFEAFAFSPRGDVLAAASGQQVRLYDPRRIAALDLALRAEDNVIGLKFSPDGRSLAVGCENGRVQIWKVR